MKTIVVDDKQLVVDGVLRILKRIDEDGTHIGTIEPFEALKMVEEEHFDVAFLDVEMPEISGIDLAKKISEVDSRLNIIFITGYENYALDAHKVYASAYLMKPIREDDVRDALAHLRYQVGPQKNIEVRCFGTFEVLYKGVPMEFKRKKTKELLAYLVDRKGAQCDADMMIGTLWPDEPNSASRQSLLRNLVADLRKTFRDVDEEDVVIKNHNGLSINTNKIKCDYYEYLKGEPSAMNKYNGEYMIQYSFGDFTQSILNEKEGI